MMRLSLYPIGGSYFLVAVVAIALLGLLMLGPPRGRLGAGRRWVLLGLRMAVVVLVILAMLRPTLVYTEVTKQAATLVVLADQSRSMSVPDALGGRKTRWQALQRSLDEAGDGLARIAEDFEVRAMTFDGKTHPVAIEDGRVQLPDEPGGGETAIGSVLDDVLRLEAGKRLLGVILLSDGAQRAYAPRDIPPQTAAANMKHLGYPLFTVTFGQARGLGQAKDVAVKDMLAAESVFVKNELDVAAQIRVDGFVNREIPVRLLFETSPGKMKIVAEKKIKATSDGQVLPVNLVYAPQTPGQYKLAVEVGDQPGELVRTNNRLSTFVNVLSGGLKVLYIEGYPPRREIRFLRESLDASADIHVDYMTLDARRPQSHPANLIERFKPGKYDAYIVGDVDSKAFTRDELTALKETVSRGAGLIMLGGFHSFGAGGYADTPLGDILPIKMSRLERQPLEQETPRKDLHLKGPLRIKPTPLGVGHYVLMLSTNPAKNAQLWSKLPPLLGANKLGELRPRALELAVDQRGRPLLVAQEFGAGRVMAFAADSTWLWHMGGFESEHKRFWRQIVLWLSRKDELGEGNVWVKLAQRRLRPGQRLEFTAGARTATGDAIENAQLAAEIIMPDGTTQAIRLARQEDIFTGTFRGATSPGDYAVRVTAVQSGDDGGEKSLGSAKTRFLVFEEDLELDNATADISAMDALSAMTGGKAVPPEQLDELLDELAANTESLENRTESKRTFWDTWPFFLLLVCFLGVEWFLRKRWGLV